MTITTFQDYQKSITVAESAKHKVLELMDATLKGSKALPLLNKVTLESKHTHIPFLHLPKDTDTTFTIGAIDVTKELENSSAKLVDETDEDTGINLESALDKILISQARMKVENYIADYLSDNTKFTPATGAAAKAFSTIVSTIESFSYQILAIEGSFVALVSFPTYFKLLSTMDNSHRELVKDGFIKLVPICGMEDTKLVVLHTQGVAYGAEIRGVEKERNAESQYTYFITQVAVGVGADSNYVKNITLAA